MRNTNLKNKRDRRMVEKFHELFDIKRIRMDDVLKELSEEYFFLDQNYIYSRIFYHEQNNQYYNELLDANK